MTGECYLDPTCERGRHAASDYPCGAKSPELGDPCQFCGVPMTILPCPDCWTPIDVPMFRALMASEGLDTVVRRIEE